MYEVKHESDPKLKEKIEEECGTHKPAIPLYLSVPVNWWGKSHRNKPLEMKMSGKRVLTQMALQSRRSKHFKPEKLADWISGKEIFFIHCSKYSTSGSRKKGSYLSVYRNEQFVAGSTIDSDESDEDEKVQDQSEEEMSHSGQDSDDDSTDDAHPRVEEHEISISHYEPKGDGSSKRPYVIGCERNIAKHCDQNTYMLFRLLKPDNLKRGK